MGGDGTKGAAAKTAAHQRDRILDHLERRDRLTISRMRLPRVGQAVDAVHRRLRQGKTGRIADYGLSAVPLNDAPRIVGIGLVMDQAGGLGKGRFVAADGLVRGNHQGVFRRRFGSAGGVGYPPHIAQISYRLPLRQPGRDFQHGILPHAEDDQIRFGIQQNGAAHGVAPVIVMGQSSQRRLDTSGDDRHALVGFTSPLAISQGRTIGSHTDSPSRGVGVIVANLAVGRVMVDHRIHVPRTDRKKQSGTAETPPVIAGMPVRLGQHGYPKSGGLQYPTQNGHGEAGVVDVRISGHEHHVHLLPASLGHLGGRHGQVPQRFRRARRYGEPQDSVQPQVVTGNRGAERRRRCRCCF